MSVWQCQGTKDDQTAEPALPEPFLNDRNRNQNSLEGQSEPKPEPLEQFHVRTVTEWKQTETNRETLVSTCLQMTT